MAGPCNVVSAAAGLLVAIVQAACRVRGEPQVHVCCRPHFSCCRRRRRSDPSLDAQAAFGEVVVSTPIFVVVCDAVSSLTPPPLAPLACPFVQHCSRQHMTAGIRVLPYSSSLPPLPSLRAVIASFADAVTASDDAAVLSAVAFAARRFPQQF
eukprot:1894827-Pleurochrysis_carterae.AAC.1